MSSHRARKVFRRDRLVQRRPRESIEQLAHSDVPVSTAKLLLRCGPEDLHRARCARGDVAKIQMPVALYLGNHEEIRGQTRGGSLDRIDRLDWHLRLRGWTRVQRRHSRWWTRRLS